MDADAVDIRANARFRDESIKEFMHETKVLKKLAGAPNVNQIFDVMEVEAQLWIISEYVPGGSVKTLVCSHSEMSSRINPSTAQVPNLE